MPQRIRTIREEPEYRADLRKIFGVVTPHPRLLDDMIEGALFIIAHDPTRGSPIMATNLRVIAQPLPPLGKVLRIYYEFDSDWVLLRAATVRDAEERA
jgi:hypothetical protein